MSKRTFTIVGITVGCTLLVVAGALLIYYQTLKSTPQYSIALLVDAAKRDDRATVNQLINVDAVVDDFVPQITSKAVELYGRGQPPEVIRRVARLALPLLPAVKERARAELPRVIRERTARFDSVPFAAMVVGADRYLDIRVDGDVATVRSKLPDHHLEMKMQRGGDHRWQIVGVRDEQVATAVARKIGQEIMAVAAGGGKNAADQYGIGNLAELLRQAEELVR